MFDGQTGWRVVQVRDERDNRETDDDVFVKDRQSRCLLLPPEVVVSHPLLSL